MKNLLIAAAVVLTPVIAVAAPVLPVVGSSGAGWVAMGAPTDPSQLTDPLNAPNLTRDDAFWAGYSYDRRKDVPSGSTACGAGALVMGFGCPWSLGGNSGVIAPAGPATPGQEIYAWGHAPGTGTAPNYNADPSFYFSGALELDLQILSEMTSWKDQVEIGWYEKDSPNATHVLIGGPGGIPKDSNGNYDLGGTTTVVLNGDYGFYYKNYERGVAFYTQSELNRFIGPPAWYLSGFGLDANSVDDEFVMDMFDPTKYQQFALFGQGNRFWLGLEDIFGPTTPCKPFTPCSDYDFNDFLIGGQVMNQVPEPTTMTMLGLGLFGVGVAVRRRRQS